MTTEEFGKCLRKMQEAQKTAGQKPLTEEEIQAMLERHRKLLRGEISIPPFARQ
jgi:hypothetical protein